MKKVSLYHQVPVPYFQYIKNHLRFSYVDSDLGNKSKENFQKLK